MAQCSSIDSSCYALQQSFLQCEFQLLPQYAPAFARFVWRKEEFKTGLIVGAPLSKGHRGTVRIGAPDFAFGHAICYRLEIGQRHSESFDFATPPS
jgi:hypothetical protein